MPQRKCQKVKAQKTRTIVLLSFIAVFMFVSLFSLVSAAANGQYDEILQPIQNVYDFVKYAVTVIAGLVLIFAGYTFITSGSDPKKKDSAKNMIMYVVIGLAIIWAAPLIVKLVLGV